MTSEEGILMEKHSAYFEQRYERMWEMIFGLVYTEVVGQTDDD